VRAAVGNVAIGYNLEFLLHELALVHELGAVQPDETLAAGVADVLDAGIPNPFTPDEDEDE